MIDWVHHARCKDEDPELFFPIGTAGPAASQIAAAKSVCLRCDVRMRCLEWAMTTGQEAGVWGGLSEEERRALRRARRRGEATRLVGVAFASGS
jgi:WhiB family redox-sensing transcriptional regulator